MCYASTNQVIYANDYIESILFDRKLLKLVEHVIELCIIQQK